MVKRNSPWTEQPAGLSALCGNGSCLLFILAIAIGYNIHMDLGAMANVQKKDWQAATCFPYLIPAENAQLFL